MSAGSFLTWTPSDRRRGVLAMLKASALLIALPLPAADRGAPSRSEPARSAPARTVQVDRSNHGSVRHAETHVIQRPVEPRREPQRPIEPQREPQRPVETRRGPEQSREVLVHHDVEAEVHRSHAWNNFVFGRRHASLPLGFLSLRLGGVPYFYSDGLYYQPADGGYQEVYPPVGAAIPQPPDGAIEIDAGGQTYYFAAGAFYVQQPDGTYAIAPTPIGVVVPELPPGAIQVSVNGTVAYQFNGIYYEPVFVNGVTQYETFAP
ncbi:MAG TPA: DUF6515 family protein [Verrucomicrobiae bacterium]|nr:DUF6515 family protein [Verrucomicrobiae bacterium]